MLKKTILDMQKIARERDGACLSKNYKNSHSLLEWKCKEGHKWSASPTNVSNKNSWCPFCAKQKSDRFTIEYMRKIATGRGGDCLSKFYKNRKTKLRWRCSNMHTWEAIPLNVVNNGSWRPFCYKKLSPLKVVKRAKLPNGYWNDLKHCEDEALKYSSRSRWQRGSPLSYRWASRNDWVEECSRHMQSVKMPDGHWTLERCVEEAKKYKTKVQWRLENYASYVKANKRGWLVHCCGHMESRGMWFGPASILEALLSYDIQHEMEYRFKKSLKISRRPFDFFLPDYNLVIEFHGEQHLIGWGRRKVDAKNIQERDSFKKDWASKNGVNYLEIKQWEIKSKEEIAQKVMQELRRIAEKNDLYLPSMPRPLTENELARIKNRLKWSRETCILEAKQYAGIQEWRLGSPSSYQAAYKRSWFDECCNHMERKLHRKNHWTLDRCLETAKQYKTKSEWQQAKRGGYSIAAKNKWIDKCTAHMVPDGRRNVGPRLWTREKCLALAKSCGSRLEFKNASGSAYLRARVKGWLDDCCYHMGK